MPCYDYRCKECAEVFQKEHKMDFKEPVQCPTCGTYLTHKTILSSPGIYFYWKDARSMSQATLPKYLRPVDRRRRTGDSAEDYGGM